MPGLVLREGLEVPLPKPYVSFPWPLGLWPVALSGGLPVGCPLPLREWLPKCGGATSSGYESTA